MRDLSPGSGRQKRLAERMRRLGVREEDVREHFLRSRGPGGQNVNKTATCVYLKHVPSGIEVKCQQERSQPFNRFLARCRLLDKIEAEVVRSALERRQALEKARRKARRRSGQAKARIRESKRRRAAVKALRAPIRDLS